MGRAAATTWTTVGESLLLAALRSVGVTNQSVSIISPTYLLFGLLKQYQMFSLSPQLTAQQYTATAAVAQQQRQLGSER